jgi:HD superfamily phosphodiesterase
VNPDDSFTPEALRENIMKQSDLLVLTCEARTTKTNKPYLALRVRLPQDNTDTTDFRELDAKIWSNALGEPLEIGRIIAAAYEEEVYQDIQQLSIKKYTLRPLDFPQSRFLPATVVAQSVLYNKFFGYAWQNTDIRDFMKNVQALLEDDNGRLKRRFIEVPAGARNHHPRRAGLLQHINEIWDLTKCLFGGMAVCYNDGEWTCGLPHFPNLVNEEIVLVGAVLHDMGKIHDYNPFTLQHDDNRTGAYFGHSVWGAMIVQELWPPRGDLELRDRLTHCILAHHGSTTTGSPINAKTPEATLLHLIDAMSARLDVHRTAEEKGLRGERPEYSKMFGDAPITPTYPHPDR